MLLLIDIGNTNTKIALYKDGFRKIWNLKTQRADTSIKGLVHNHKIEGAILCSVVPALNPLIINTIKKESGIRPLVVNHKLKSGLRYKIKRPDRLGPDRIAIAAGARRLYKGNLIVVCFGTATTFSLIMKNGDYMGGAIMPGLGISSDVLTEKTALLPGIKLRRPEHIIGRDTRENMLTGLIIGHAGATGRIIEEMKKEAGLRPVIIATGGFADLVVPYIGVRHVNPYLSLEGLRVLYELNVK
jgi:type III pantothenate kinase